jgi:transposase
VLYIAATSCQWRALPKCFAPFTTVQHYFYRWRDDGTLARINLIGLIVHEANLQDRDGARKVKILVRGFPATHATFQW